MTKQEKLTKLIEMAVENGYKFPVHGKFEGVMKDALTGEYYVSLSSGAIEVSLSIAGIFNSHKFAKAIWKNAGDTVVHGEGEPVAMVTTIRLSGNILTPSWEWHIQRAVISDDPLEYYWKNK